MGSSFLLAVLVVLTIGCARNAAGTREIADVSACGPIQRKEVHETLLKPEAIVSVSTLREKKLVTRPSPLKLERARRQAEPIGVRIVLRPTVGLTAEWLQLLANCDQALPFDPGLTHASCPFELTGTTALVSSLGDSFALDVTASDPAVIHELLQRAEAPSPSR